MKNRLIIFLFSFIILCSHAQEGELDISLFASPDLTELNKDVTLEQICSVKHPVLRETAMQIYHKTYPLKDRLRNYECYLSPSILAERLKTSPYSQFENPTGIFFDEAGEIVVWVGSAQGHTIELKIADFAGRRLNERTYHLKEGINTIFVANTGLGYINYYTEGEVSSHKIPIHILGGKLNRVFEAGKDDNDRWDMLLENAVSPVIDIVGKKTHLIYSVKSLKEQALHQGVELISLYDSIITIQHSMMGLVKYNREPKNHMLGRVIWRGFMHADQLGAAFHEDTMKELANVEKLKKNSWGVAHEFGHVNQVRPDMKWVGTTEVTNNIYSVWTQYLFNPDSPKLEREKLKDYDGQKIGGRITAYMESAFVHHQPWLTQAGNDRWDRERPRDWGGDHFVKLVPLWQLQLYFAVAGKGNSWGNENFYGDIFIKAIDAPKFETENMIRQSYFQLQFIKNACEVAQLDLTDFFEKSCMLFPVDLWVDDYTCDQMTITEDDIRTVKEYASKYKKPTTPVLHYITANSVDVYRKELPLKGNKGKGYVKHEDHIVVDNSAWKNAVAFETYQGDNLIKIAFVGAGSDDVKTTIVQIPQETTSVKAVGWNGERKDVL